MKQIRTKLQLFWELLKANHRDPPSPPSAGAVVTRIIPPLPKEGKRLLTGLVVQV
jgi:hypothetical protein